jgi:hypothetical protein
MFFQFNLNFTNIIIEQMGENTLQWTPFGGLLGLVLQYI